MKRQEHKQKPRLQVKRMFEPDRMSPINLQAAYERVLPSRCYRIISLERKCETKRKVLDLVAEVTP